MYVPAHFKSEDLTQLDWLAGHDAFGTLISQVQGTPFASHLPVLYRREGNTVVLSGHWARPNAQWHDIEGQRALCIFHGPHAYISPRWYVEPQKHVPTWDYAVAHVYGPVRVIREAAELEPIVASLASNYEAGAANPWTLAGSNPGNRQMLRGIVGFELRADEVQLKFKLNQNHPAGNIRGAIDGLRASGGEDSLAVASLMEAAQVRAMRD